MGPVRHIDFGQDALIAQRKIEQFRLSPFLRLKRDALIVDAGLFVAGHGWLLFRRRRLFIPKRTPLRCINNNRLMSAAKPESRYDVFISYRRGTADELALLLQTHLQRYGCAVFLDRDLRRGVFDDMLLRRIAESATFLVILTPNALDRCSDEEDWLRKEIVQAISSKRNIIPLQVNAFEFTPEVVKELDPSVRELARYQTVEYSRVYFENTVERIVRIIQEDKAERKAAEEKEMRLAAELVEEMKRRRVNRRARPETQGKTETEGKTIEPKKQQRLVGSRLTAALHFLREFLLRKTLWWAGGFAVLVLSGGSYWLLPYLHETRSGPEPMVTPSSQQNEGLAPGTSKTNPKDGLKYVWIPAGSFQMGCSADDKECRSDEVPPHLVSISKGFWMGQTPVTQAAYRRVMHANPSHYHGDQLPVETVTWNQAQDYCQAAAGRLPTEAEWEYAARARTTAARYGDIDGIAWYADNSGNTRIDSTVLSQDRKQNYPQKLEANGNRTHRVGQKQQNGWGLYDMLGNVHEWVADWYDAYYYKDSPSIDPKGPAQTQSRVIRGGSWFVWPGYVRSSSRGAFGPVVRVSNLGFRCVLEVLP